MKLLLSCSYTIYYVEGVPMKLKFTKMQGCGNDYLYVNCMDGMIPEPVRSQHTLVHGIFPLDLMD